MDVRRRGLRCRVGVRKESARRNRSREPAAGGVFYNGQLRPLGVYFSDGGLRSLREGHFFPGQGEEQAECEELFIITMKQNMKQNMRYDKNVEIGIVSKENLKKQV